MQATIYTRIPFKSQTSRKSVCTSFSSQIARLYAEMSELMSLFTTMELYTVLYSTPNILSLVFSHFLFLECCAKGIICNPQRLGYRGP